MSQVPDQQTAVIRAWMDAFARWDVDAMLAVAHEDIVVDWSRSRGPEAGVYAGQAAARRLFATYAEVQEVVAVEFGEPVAVGESFVLPNLARVRSRVGIELSVRSALVFEPDGERVRRTTMYQTAEEAMGAAQAAGS